MEDLLADRVSLVDASGIRKVFALAAELENPVNFSIGQPDFDVPDALKEEAIRAIREGANRYSQTAGDGGLLEKMKTRMKGDFGWDNPSVLVTSGVSGGLLLAFMAMINPGDEVIVPDPYFVIYKHVIRMLGGKCVFVDSYPSFRLPVEGIANAITERTKLIIVNSPSNPTGIVYTEDELRAVAEVAGRQGIPIMTDEIYEKFCYDGECPSVGRFYERALVLGGFSKSYAMTGWRLGYAAGQGPMAAVIEAMTKLQQYTFVCAPAPFQQAAVAAMDYDVSALVDVYRKKRDLLCAGLDGAFEVARPGGAFYAFVRAPGDAATPFVEKAIKNNVLVIPGNVFSERDSHFRISYATSDSEIERGVGILKGLVQG